MALNGRGRVWVLVDTGTGEPIRVLEDRHSAEEELERLSSLPCPRGSDVALFEVGSGRTEPSGAV